MLWDLSSLAAGQLLSMALGLLAFVYLARTLSPESYGLVEYTVGLAALAAVIIEGGTGAIGALRVARAPGQAAALAGHVPVARFAVALLVVPLVGLTGHLTGSEPGTTAVTWLFAASLVAIPFKQDWLFQGLERMTSVALAQVLKAGAFALGVVLLVRGPGDLVLVGMVEVVAALLMAGYFVLVQWRLTLPIGLRLPLAPAWELLRAGAPVGASTIVWAFMVYVPVFLVARLAGSVEAAWMGGVQRIVLAAVSFSALYFFNLYPVIARGLSEDTSLWQRLMGSSFRVTAWASIGVALCVTLLAEPIVRLLFGAAFLPAAPVLAIYIWMLPLRLLSGHARWSLLAAERQGVLLGVELGCASTLVVLGLVLVPAYGAPGAAAAALLANVVGWTAAHVCALKYIGSLPGIRQLLLPAGAALVSGSLAYAVVPHPVAGPVVAVLAYLSCLRLGASEIVGDAVRLAYAKRTAPEARPAADV